MLVAIAELQSLGGAARRLGTTQPNASRLLARLERHLGVALVDRSPTGSRLTTEGTVVVEWAREALQAMERVVLGSQALGAGRRSSIAVHASMTVAEHLVPAWLAELRRRLPDVHVSLCVCNSRAVVDAVAGGVADLGFLESPRQLAGLRSLTVACDRLVVVVGAGHPWARRRRPVTLGELAATPLLLREPGSGTRETLERLLRSAALPPVSPELQLSSNAAVKVSASAGLAPAVLSELAVADAVTAGTLTVVPVEGLAAQRRLRAVWRPTARLTGAPGELVRIARLMGSRATAGPASAR